MTRRLVEPFAGGLAAALGLLPETALLNDINPYAINLYRWLKKGLVVSIPMVNDATLYYTHRQRFNTLTREGDAESQELAELFYYLNRTGYNGLCRFNQKGEFNVPFGQYGSIGYVRDFVVYRKTFANWEFTTGDFESVRLRPGDFVYADPPYDVEFTRYAKEGFRWADQVRMVSWLAQHDGPVVISNQATERVVDLYSQFGFDLHFLLAPRRISCNGDRSPAREVLATRGVGSMDSTDALFEGGSPSGG